MIWVQRTADGVFLRDKGLEAVSAGESTITVTRRPDPRTERADGTDPSGIRAASAPEIAAYDAERRDLLSGRDTDLMLRAVAQLDFEERQKLVVEAGQTLRTQAQCLARVKAIYRALLDG
jgi:hypothetical protein